jgi:hypothetical protein
MRPLSRRVFLKATAAAVCCGDALAGKQDQISVGAIRWDAWYTKKDDSIFAQNNLASKIYQSRAPVHCSFNGEIICIGGQEIMDAEIVAAANGGLSFWAFDWFPATSSFHKAWELYQSSKLQLIKWCPIIGLADLGSPSGSTDEINKKLVAWVEKMTSPKFFHVHVAGTLRPLMFLFYRETELKTYFNGLDRLRSCLSELRALAIKHGVASPYIVLFDPSLDMNIFRNSGADALSNYISDFKPVERGAYKDLDGQVRRYWSRMAATGAEMIPIAQVGWDTRPRNDHPVPWNHDDVRKSNATYYEMATEAEFYVHMRAAGNFVASNPASCAARTVLLYSWDECDEGGCIMPTRGDPGGKYLSALKMALK